MQVLAAIGVRDTGESVPLHLALGSSESAAAWRAFLDQLVSRGLRASGLVVIDGHKGLRRAVRETWPQVVVQRCTLHKAENLRAPCPKWLHDELHMAGQAEAVVAGGQAVLTESERMLRSSPRCVRARGRDARTLAAARPP